MHTREELQQSINAALEQIHFSNKPPELYEPISYALTMGGKRMRPLLCLMACEMFGKDAEASLQAALGIEIFHNFTLLHDDIMDNAPIRRGMETVFKKWDTNIAILSGDTMFAIAFKCMLQTDTPNLSHILKVFNTSAIEVCEGQQLDMNFESLDDVTIDDYIGMIRLKTAVLLAASLKIGAIIGGAESKDQEHIYAFGEKLGISFQLMDDLLDIYGDEDKFGKIQGGDIVSNKKTFLFLKAMEESEGETYNKLLSCFSNKEMEEHSKVKEVKMIYDQLHIKEITETEIEKYYLDAIRHLNSISLPEKQKEALRAMALSVFRRKK